MLGLFGSGAYSAVASSVYSSIDNGIWAFVMKYGVPLYTCLKYSDPK